MIRGKASHRGSNEEHGTKNYRVHALVVRDYDEAIHYYTSVLGFLLIEDTKLTDEKRWVLVAPSAESETRLLLARAVGADQASRIGNQTGGRVFLFLSTDDFWRDYNALTSRPGSAGVSPAWLRKDN